MKLESFRNMWERDGFSLTEHERRVRSDATWILVTVLSNQFTDEYGRHFGITLAVDKNEEILAHDTINLRDSTNPTRETMRWFEENIKSGLV